MSHTIIIGPEFNEPLAKWACARIPWLPYSSTLKAVGVADGSDASAKLLAVCLYHNYVAPQMIDGKPWYGLCEISFAAASPKWATRGMIRDLMSIPFSQYACRKVVTVIPSTNKRAIRFNEGIGLKPEGTLRHHFAKNVHACIHGIMRSEYEARWQNRPAIRSPKDRRLHGLQGQQLGTASH